ncbi:dihydrofolate reductase family protein [Aeromicrobium panaciterrae]|uniref:dihydrofolate reductase family protein n=1 Tax=Aeromicrobium panaciterrae TaxID=363861 RepID=UPI0031CE7270
MGTLTVDWFTSLDGYGLGEGWPPYFGLEGPGMFDWVMEQQDRPHTILMGATTYREMADVVQHLGDDPTLESLMQTPKIVFSSHLQEPLSWVNTELVREDAIAHIRTLKEQPGAMRTIGSLSLGRALLAAELVDRLRVMVFPLVLGNTGRQPVYDGLPDLSLELISSRTLDGRLLLLDYTPSLV